MLVKHIMSESVFRSFLSNFEIDAINVSIDSSVYQSSLNSISAVTMLHGKLFQLFITVKC